MTLKLSGIVHAPAEHTCNVINHITHIIASGLKTIRKDKAYRPYLNNVYTMSIIISADNPNGTSTGTNLN